MVVARDGKPADVADQAMESSKEASAQDTKLCVIAAELRADTYGLPLMDMTARALSASDGLADGRLA